MVIEALYFILLFLFVTDVTKSVQVAFDLHKISDDHKSMDKAENELNGRWKHYENLKKNVLKGRKAKG